MINNAVSLNDKKAFYKNEIENISSKIYNKEQKQLAFDNLQKVKENLQTAEKNLQTAEKNLLD